MTGNLWLDWVLLTISLFNTILLIWLGMTVLLNAERRSWGVWLGGIGLLAGAIFFISHTALISQPLFPLSDTTDFWWHAGWGPVVLAPFAWYVMVLWYTGYWDDPHSALNHRHRVFLILILLFTALLVGLVLFGNPLPTVETLGQFIPNSVPSLAGIPLLILAYPLYIFLSISLALDALLRPGPSGRFMGDQARRLARPFLIATSATLMLVSLLVGWVMLWLYTLLETAPAWQVLAGPVVMTLAWFDCLIAALIGLAVLMIGQAIVSYEIFTGRTLPRRGFLRQWHNTIILAADVSCVVAASLVFNVRPVYSLLLTILLMTIFYALFNWRMGEERERLTSRLRPFVTSQRLFDRLLEPEPAGSTGLDELFETLCSEVLDTRRACLVALGPLSPLAGPPLFYPSAASFQLPDLVELSAHFQSPHILGLPLSDPGLSWAVPLWSDRGLVGILLLGEKRDGGFYTEEEMEIARASGERLIDNGASAEIARRLIALQRQRLVDSQVLDRQTRRVLHDDVLPLLHAALLQLSAEAAGQKDGETIASLSQAHRQISDLLHDLPPASPPQLAHLGLAGALRQLVQDEFGQGFDRVDWQVEEQAQLRAGQISPLTAQVIYYAAREAVRNSARHARRAGAGEPLVLTVSLSWKEGLVLVVQDNGSGFSYQPSESPAGSGQGLALHSTMMAVVGGTLAVENQPGAFTRVILTLPAANC